MKSVEDNIHRSRLMRRLTALVLAGVMGFTWASSAAAGEWFCCDPDRFAEDVAAGKTVFVVVHADWCTTCRAQASIMLDVTAEEPLKDVIGYVVDFDTEIEFLFDHYVRVQSTPIVFTGGEEVAPAIAITDPELIWELFLTGVLTAPVVN